MTENIRPLRTQHDLIDTYPASDDGLTFKRVFTKAGTDPLQNCEWQRRSAMIRNDKGQIIFEQNDVEAPSFWSDMAINVVVSKYFRGVPGTPDRENSIKGLISRVVLTIKNWGVDQRYFQSEEQAEIFSDELAYLLLHQMASFNSPVWFNVGVMENPQCSACFILNVEDTMESILNWYAQEGMIFKGGSGAGINISSLRASNESLAGGGTASGPISFMKAADASAGVIKSGGKTRRAAKMVIMDIDHPDILPFITCKATEERKAHALIKAGYDGSLDGEAYSTVAFQNANHSVRVTDEFMEADRQDLPWHTRFRISGEASGEYKARELMREMAKATHACGDPGIQFHTTINKYHTCPANGPINASNPCSEYMHVDNSACNLSSLKLTSFLNGQGFRSDLFRHAVDIMITAQEILVDKAGYPNQEIGRNSANLRALGLGFADLGALLMSLGLPYDSDAGRSWASVLTAMMTGEAYLQSSRIARHRGTFADYPQNRDAMLRVMRMHRKNLQHIALLDIPEALSAEVSHLWDEVIRSGESHGYRNCQVTVLAPTGTVAFMMDCDTTGVEPELALVKFKNLSGGGRLRIVNRTVAKALEKLEYPPMLIPQIIEKIEENGTIEGIGEVQEEHLAVFDCSFKPLNGQRSISVKGHLRMMAAVQPFLSGAISKTVNVAADTTVEQIEEIFRLAWRLGLKSVAIYRDGCKAMQPLGLSEETETLPRPEPVRRRLPVNCKSVRHKFDVGGLKGYLHVGFYDDEKVGEIFVRIAKEGSTISGLMDTVATLTSIALQYGVPLEALVSKFSHVRFEPSGFTGNSDIPIAKSLTDYIFRFLGIKYLSPEQQEIAGLLQLNHASDTETAFSKKSHNSTAEISHNSLFKLQTDAPACSDCGSLMVRNGSCYKCLNCGGTSGCS